jgi:hypothetical protein
LRARGVAADAGPDQNRDDDAYPTKSMESQGS